MIIMGQNTKIVCLCGSTRFISTFQRAEFEETLAGKIVLTIGCDTRSDGDLFRGEEGARIKQRLDELHLKKIAMADEILVLNDLLPWCTKCGVFRHICYMCESVFTGEMRPYIGDSTRREIDCAIALGKLVRYLNPPM